MIRASLSLLKANIGRSINPASLPTWTPSSFKPKRPGDVVQLLHRIPLGGGKSIGPQRRRDAVDRGVGHALPIRCVPPLSRTDPDGDGQQQDGRSCSPPRYLPSISGPRSTRASPRPRRRGPPAPPPSRSTPAAPATTPPAPGIVCSPRPTRPRSACGRSLGRSDQAGEGACP